MSDSHAANPTRMHCGKYGFPCSSDGLYSIDFLQIAKIRSHEIKVLHMYVQTYNKSREGIYIVNNKKFECHYKKIK